jgi:hypothetical protein
MCVGRHLKISVGHGQATGLDFKLQEPPAKILKCYSSLSLVHPTQSLGTDERRPRRANLLDVLAMWAPAKTLAHLTKYCACNYIHLTTKSI